ncbi:Ig-like domain-containing protein [Nocardioides sp. GCM10027113]|uniref:Ig-like domain-containing protein n=1 Tax=unclassified Nocardioides TaxID=2615069 RepID=UPI003614BF86
MPALPRLLAVRGTAPALLALLVATLLPVLVPTTASGTAADADPGPCTIDWDHGAGTDRWLDAGNWTGDRLPAVDDVVCVSAAAVGHSVVVDGPDVQQVRAIRSNAAIRVLAEDGAGLHTAMDSYIEGLFLESGLVRVDTSLLTAVVEQGGGALGGSGDITVDTRLRWYGGQQFGAGTTRVTGADQEGGHGAYLSGGQDLHLRGRTVRVDRGLRLAGATTLELGRDARVVAAGESRVVGHGTVEGEGGLDLLGHLVVEPDNTLTVATGMLAGPESQVVTEAGARVLITPGQDQEADLAGAVLLGVESTVRVGTGVRFSETSRVVGHGTLGTVAGEPRSVVGLSGDADVRTLDLDGVALVTGRLQASEAVLRGELFVEPEGITAGTLTLRDAELAGHVTVTGAAEAEGVTKVWGEGALDVGGRLTVRGSLRVADASLTARDLVVDAGPDADAALSLSEGGRVRVAGRLTTAGAASIVADDPYETELTVGELLVQGNTVSSAMLDIRGEQTLEVAAGGRLHQDGPLTQRGTARVFGELVVDGPAILQEDLGAGLDAMVRIGSEGNVLLGTDAVLGGLGADVVVAGALTGDGTLLGSVRNEGRISPTGTIRAEGSYTQTADGKLRLRVDATRAEALQVSGRVWLDGTLALGRADGALPRTELHDLVTSTGRTGEFVQVETDDPCSEISYGENLVTLVPQSCVTVHPGSGVEIHEKVRFDVRLPRPAEAMTVVHWTRVNGSAGDDDFVGEPTGRVTLLPGEMSRTIEIPVVDDDIEEDDETFTLALTAEGARLARPEVTGTIIDDDEALDYRYQPVPLRSGGMHWDTGLGTSWVTGVDLVEGETSLGWVYRISDGKRYAPRNGFLPYAINDLDVAVGACEGNRLCVRDRGVDTPLPGDAGGDPTVINDRGVIGGAVHDKAAYWPDRTSAPVDLGMGPRSRVTDINERGDMVGVVRDGMLTTAWLRLANGRVHDVPVVDGMEGISDVNITDDGLVAGTAYVPDQWGHGPSHGFTWRPGTPLTDLGADTAVHDVNSAGHMVGSRGGRATLWKDGRVTDLNQALPKDVRKTTNLFYALYINEQGTIYAGGSQGLGRVGAVLVPPGAGCRVCVEADLQEAAFPDPESFVDVGRRVVEGTPARVRAVVRNNTSQPQALRVVVTGPDGRLGEPESLDLAPGEEVAVTRDVDTDGLAWQDGAERAPVPFDVRVEDAAGNDVADWPLELKVVPRPVVAVHGMNSDASTWIAYDGFTQGAHSGWRTFAVDTMDTTSVVPNTVAQNARRLAAYVEQVQRGQNAWQVDLVAHSMGGLISRYYIARLMPEHDGIRPARRLVMLGTPNAGSYCANLFTAPMTVELRTDVMTVFNASVTERRGVPFSIGAGDPLPTTCGEPGPSDMVVALWSAFHGIEDRTVFPILHTSMTGSEQMFDEYVAPRLNGTVGAGAGAGASRLDGDAAEGAAGESGTSAAPQLLVRDELTVAPGETGTSGFYLQQARPAIGTAALAPPSVEVVLVRGEQSATSADDPARDSGFQTARVADAARGGWAVRVTNHGSKPVTVPLATWVEGDETRLEAHVEQVGLNGRALVTARLTGAPLERPFDTMLATTTTREGETFGVTLVDDGTGGDRTADDGTWSGVLTDLAQGPVAVDVTTDDPGFHRTVSAATVLTAGVDGPGNDAPVALPSEVTVPGTVSSAIEVEAGDPEGEPLQFEIVDQPEHGRVGGSGPVFDYLPDTGYVGSDSFTWRAFDGQRYSEPATVSITVTGAPTELQLDRPGDRRTTSGSPTHFLVSLRDVLGERVHEGEVTFEFAGHTATARLADGPAEATIPADVPPGDTELVVRFGGTDRYAPTTLRETIHVGAGTAPVPTLRPVTGEAGYVTRLIAQPGDPDGDVATVEFDVDGDGTWDAEVADGSVLVHLDHVYAEAFDGTARIRVTDRAGHVAVAEATATVAPYRPLGALQRILVDGSPIRVEDISDDGRYVLYEVRDRAPRAFPFAVLDRQTGEHEVVSVMPDGSEVDHPGTAVLSPDGRTVAFNAMVPVNGRTPAQTFVRDLDADTTRLVSRNATGQLASWHTFPEVVTDDGVAWFTSTSDNLAGRDIGCGTSNCMQLYVADPTGLQRVSSPDGAPVEYVEHQVGVTPDGRYVAYGAGGKLWVVDRVDGTREKAADTESSWDIQSVSISEDGQDVWFTSEGDQLVPDDANGHLPDVFHLDRRTGRLALVTVTPEGVSPHRGGQTYGQNRAVDACGNVVFQSWSSDLVEGDGNDMTDVFLRDSARTRRLSVEARDGAEATGDSFFPVISGNGRWVVFWSDADDLVPGDVEGQVDSFLLDLGAEAECGHVPPENRAPAAADVTAEVDEDSTAVIRLEGTDADGDPLTYEVVDAPQHGTLTGGGQDRSYAPVADWSGTDSFTYRVSDGEEWSATATVTVEVRPVNDAPTAGPDLEVTTAQDTPVDVELTGSDVDGDPLTVELVDAPAHGAVTGQGAARTYVPEPGWSGTDTFTWRVTDGAATSAVSTVTVTVTPAPRPAWPFDGFHAPVDNPPVVNVVKAGSSVPLKFGLGEYRGMEIFEAGFPASRRHACDSTAESDALESTATPGSSGLTWDAGTSRYHYVWKTQKSWAGQCRTLVLRFRDGSERTAEFRFR